MWSVTLSRKWSNANFKVAGYQTSCFEMWPDVLPDFRYPSSLQLLINRVAVKTMVYMTCQRTAALHYPSVPASHPERGKRKIAAMWIWFMIPEMRQTVLTRKIRLISMQFKITIWLQQLKHTHTHKGRYAHSFSTLLHSTLHHRLLINHCIWLLIRPSLLKLLDLVSTFSPLISSFRFSCSAFASLLAVSSFPRQRVFQTVLQGLFSSVGLSTDISAPWFRSNYIGINDDSPWMHFSTLSVNPSGTGPGAQQSLAAALQERVRYSRKFLRKDRDLFLSSLDFRVIT